MPFWTLAGVGVQLRVIANESEPNPSPPADGRRRSQTAAASARGCPPCREPVRVDLRHHLIWGTDLQPLLCVVVRTQSSAPHGRGRHSPTSQGTGAYKFVAPIVTPTTTGGEAKNRVAVGAHKTPGARTLGRSSLGCRVRLLATSEEDLNRNPLEEIGRYGVAWTITDLLGFTR